jgi:protein subunit release factor B
MISDKKIEEIKLFLKKLTIQDSDLEEKFIIGSGRGGQNLQKTSSCVQLKHIPSGIQVRCSTSRQREENRWLARRLLCEKIAHNNDPENSPETKLRHKIRKQKQKSQKRSRLKHKETDL